jgi:hypothetical protein
MKAKLFTVLVAALFQVLYSQVNTQWITRYNKHPMATALTHDNR